MLYIIYNINFKNPSFLEKILKKKKSFGKRPKGWELSGSPLLESFRTFKGNIVIDNIRLIS